MKHIRRLPFNPGKGGWLAALVTVAALLLQQCDNLPTAKNEITAATWNLRWFPAGQIEPQEAAVEEKTVGAAGKYIADLEPHIICLQEIRDAEAARALARATGLDGFKLAICTDFPHWDGTPGLQQTAILTRFRVIETASRPWRAVGTVDPPRGYAYALLDTPAGVVAVYSIHLKSNIVPKGSQEDRQIVLNRLKRELAAEQLRRHADGLAKREAPVAIVVAGDFNTSIYEDRWEGETTIQSFLDEGYSSCFEGLPAERTHTLPGNNYYPPVTFDYILHKGFESQSSPLIEPKRWVSDHRMVSVKLTLPPPTSEE